MGWQNLIVKKEFILNLFYRSQFCNSQNGLKQSSTSFNLYYRKDKSEQINKVKQYNLKKVQSVSFRNLIKVQRLDNTIQEELQKLEVREKQSQIIMNRQPSEIKPQYQRIQSIIKATTIIHNLMNIVINRKKAKVIQRYRIKYLKKLCKILFQLKNIFQNIFIILSLLVCHMHYKTGAIYILGYILINGIIHRDLKQLNLAPEKDGYMRLTDLQMHIQMRETMLEILLTSKVMCRMNCFIVADDFSLRVITYELMHIMVEQDKIFIQVKQIQARREERAYYWNERDIIQINLLYSQFNVNLKEDQELMIWKKYWLKGFKME
ncbi:unnamed protein product [Paramecium sonneborni]|uniref:Uncharacterized protein n=1 Tax=Paramecium sonneborni TaxID=65129 RepID=A0A8S1RVJ1_9CILI|nr:unnamed protein product [Paramecium sonneborni]